MCYDDDDGDVLCFVCSEDDYDDDNADVLCIMYNVLR